MSGSKGNESGKRPPDMSKASLVQGKCATLSQIASLTHAGWQ